MKKNIIFLVFLLCVCSTFSQNNLTEGLVAYYPLNGFTSALDYSGLDNHGQAPLGSPYQTVNSSNPTGPW